MAGGQNRSGKSTKKWILDTALLLFNQQGSQNISTKRIAKEMGISPGNLHYHFKKKEEIIRALLISPMDEVQASMAEPRSSLEDFLHSMESILYSWKKYHFFKRELYYLLQADQELKDWYSNLRVQSKEGFHVFWGEWIDQGLLKDSRASEDTLFDGLWLIGEGWINFLEVNHQPIDDSNLLRGIQQMIQSLWPFLQVEARIEVDLWLAQLESKGEKQC